MNAGNFDILLIWQKKFTKWFYKYKAIYQAFDNVNLKQGFNSNAADIQKIIVLMDSNTFFPKWNLLPNVYVPKYILPLPHSSRNLAELK